MRETNIVGIITSILLVVVLLIVVILFWNSWVVVKPGTVGVQVTFGSVSELPLEAGSHFLNPFSSIRVYNTVQQTWKEEHIQIPSKDQLMTSVDVSVQYRIIASQAAQILKETGSEEQAIIVHLEPKLRSALREVGKSLDKAEDFFNDTTQVKLQAELKEELSTYCKPKGIEIQAILLRDMQLPEVVKTSVNAKKQREQLAIQQQAELARFTVEAQQKVATAEAEKAAATFEADKVKIAADAEAYKIKTINEAASSNPVYVQLQALKTLEAMSKDPAAKLYFMDGQGKSPLPLLHLGDADPLKK